MFFSNFLSVGIALIVIVIVYYKWAFTYWKRRSVQTPPTTIPFGNIGDVIFGKKGVDAIFRDIYHYFKQNNLPYGGIYFFAKKIFVVIDLELIKCILQKDFEHFINHGTYINEDADPLTGSLFGLEDAKWRNIRVKLTPTFTSGKMKMMFHTLADCTVDLVDNINQYCEDKTAVDIKEVLSCFSTDIIASCAFGIECNAQKNPDAEFRKYGRKVFDSSSISQFLRNVMQFVLPRSFLNFVKFKVTDPEVEDFFINMVKNTVEYREKNNIFRKDFMHLLIQLKNMDKVIDDGKITDDNSDLAGLTINEVAAHAFVFYSAGFETSSTTMTFALYEISINLKIQKKLREEIQEVLRKYDNQICYKAIMDLHYMDKVVYETLRKYPPVSVITRQCNEDYPIPGHNLTIEKGTLVGIPVNAIQRDHEYYPNPEVFDPERFNEENKANRPSYTWLPFGEGPRICIGLRFGMMQTKVGLTALLRNFEITINKKTLVPLQFDPRAPILSSKGGVWLDVKKIH